MAWAPATLLRHLHYQGRPRLDKRLCLLENFSYAPMRRESAPCTSSRITRAASRGAASASEPSPILSPPLGIVRN